MNSKAVSFIILSFAIGFLIGSLNNEESYHLQETQPTHLHDHNIPHNHDHPHETISIPENTPVPSVDLIVDEDPKGGWNLQIITQNFTLSPQKVNQAHIEGEGHAHLYIDDNKITRIYSPWLHIPKEWLSSGTHEIKVTLSSNDHREYTYKGKPISDTKTITLSK